MRKIILLILTTFCVASLGAQSLFYSPMSKVALPPLPTSLSFAGEEVSLNNYDVRESLTHEMLVTCYLHSRTMLTLLNTKRYFQIIEPIMERYGIPNDFKYLCMAESGLDPNAVSSAKAGGLWQIMTATGRSFGLDVGSQVDERFHIEKCTEAACKYILNSYNLFGSWTMAAAAYNLGDAGVRRRIDAQGVSNYYDAFFPSETQRYLFRILSFKLITENPSFYGYEIAEQDYYKPLTDYVEISVNAKVIDWSELAAEHGTNYKMLRQLNHWIRDYKFNNSSGKTYVVKVPRAGFRTAPN